MVNLRSFLFGLFVNSSAPITLLTDFGLRDTYVGQVKGVIAGIAPHAIVIDLTHEVAPQNLIQGAMIWAEAVAAFPPGTIHVGVVDPGVGTTRRAIAAEIGPWRFVAPDNGLLTIIQQQWPTQQAVELNRDEWHRNPRSKTFHGRDVFAPVAAHWWLGTPLHALGTPLTSELGTLKIPIAQTVTGGLNGEVLWTDHFGNLITSIRRNDVPGTVPPERITVEIAGRQLHGLKNCYGDAASAECLALWSSGDRLEIAAAGTSAAQLLGVTPGAAVHVRWDGPA